MRLRAYRSSLQEKLLSDSCWQLQANWGSKLQVTVRGAVPFQFRLNGLLPKILKICFYWRKVSAQLGEGLGFVGAEYAVSSRVSSIKIKGKSVPHYWVSIWICCGREVWTGFYQPQHVENTKMYFWTTTAEHMQVQYTCKMSLKRMQNISSHLFLPIPYCDFIF